jgi:hypothetical protein
MKHERDFLDSLVTGACTELFGAYGVNLTRNAGSPPVEAPEVSSGGVLAFSSDAMKGTILLVASFDLLAASRPPETRRQLLTSSSAADWLIVRDWSMELVNQLFGRIRNKMYGYGVRLTAKAPTAVSGQALAVAMRLRTSAPYNFLVPDGRGMRLWLDGSLSPGFTPGPLPADPQGTGNVREGDVLVF